MKIVTIKLGTTSFFHYFPDVDLTVLKGIGPAKARLFEEHFGVKTLEQLLRVMPLRYEEPAQCIPLQKWEEGQKVQVQGVVQSISMFRPPGRPATVRAQLQESEGPFFEALWFRQPWRRKSLKEGQTCFLEGKVSVKDGKPRILSPRNVLPGEVGQTSLTPVYSEAPGLSSAQFRKTIRMALEYVGEVPETLPAKILKEARVPSLSQALHTLHAPQSADTVEYARRRIAWGEVLALELRRRQQSPRTTVSDFQLSDAVWARILSRLPFELTKDQQAVWKTLRKDLESGQPLRRLLHGEVGSGKTAVAFALALAVVAQGGQVALLAPTEILARQHAQTFRTWLEGAALRQVSFLGDDTPAIRREALAATASGRAQISIGTHALFESDVRFANLQLVLFDEQHRFGVRQKTALVAKGKCPHVLTMTATPIPRTLAWSRYGALDPCVLRSRAGNNAEITTHVRAQDTWEDFTRDMRRPLEQGMRMFVVCPRIDGEDGLLAQAQKTHQTIWKNISHQVVHGRLPGAEVADAVEKFRNSTLQVLWGTSIVEVGLDIPGIPCMAVQQAHHFGLASLHQLRGRLSRGSQASDGQCFLFSDPVSMDRLAPLTYCADGFSVAELDLKTRGAGQLFGVKQHGHTGFRVFDPLRDTDLVKALRRPSVEAWFEAKTSATK